MLPARVERLPIIGVMGSALDEHEPRSGELGRALAKLRVHLLTGGGEGVMLACSRAFTSQSERAGLCLGILPAPSDFMTDGVPPPEPSRIPPSDYPNPYVEIVIATHLPFRGEKGTDALSRNHINILSSDLVIALPGGAGTLSEVLLALRYQRPVIAYLEQPSDLPGLPGSVAVRSSLAEVLEFVGTKLGTRGAR